MASIFLRVLHYDNWQCVLFKKDIDVSFILAVAFHAVVAFLKALLFMMVVMNSMMVGSLEKHTGCSWKICGGLLLMTSVTPVVVSIARDVCSVLFIVMQNKLITPFSFVHYLADETAPSAPGLDHLVLVVTTAPVVSASKAPPVLVVVARTPVVVESSNRLHDLGDVLPSIVDMTSAVTVSGAGNGETSSIDIAEVENDYFKAIASFDEVQQVGQPAEDEMFIEAFVTKYLDGSDEISTELVGPKDVFFVNLLESRPLSVIFRP